jgi:hypothetical protein
VAKDLGLRLGLLDVRFGFARAAMRLIVCPRVLACGPDGDQTFPSALRSRRAARPANKRR